MFQQRALRQRLSWIIWVGIAWVILGWAAGVRAALPIAQSTSPNSPPPAVEWLKFQVPSDQQPRFIQQDAAIWTPVLASYPGFQTKEIWVDPASPDELVMVIHWDSFAQWQAIPQDVLDRTTQRFHQAMESEYPPEVIGFNLVWDSKTDFKL